VCASPRKRGGGGGLAYVKGGGKKERNEKIRRKQKDSGVQHVKKSQKTDSKTGREGGIKKTSPQQNNVKRKKKRKQRGGKAVKVRQLLKKTDAKTVQNGGTQLEAEQKATTKEKTRQEEKTRGNLCRKGDAELAKKGNDTTSTKNSAMGDTALQRRDDCSFANLREAKKKKGKLTRKGGKLHRENKSKTSGRGALRKRIPRSRDARPRNSREKQPRLVTMLKRRPKREWGTIFTRHHRRCPPEGDDDLSPKVNWENPLLILRSDNNMSKKIA